jgi:hypothetical protein
MREATIVLKNTHISNDFDITDSIPDQGSPVITKNEDAFASYSIILLGGGGSEKINRCFGGFGQNEA